MGTEPPPQPGSATDSPALTALNGLGTEEPAWLDSARLFAGRTEIRLRHRGEEYRLRITRQGKLILTK